MNKEAEALFSWVSGNKSGTITVSDYRENPLNCDDWKVNLALKASISISKNNDIELETIELSLEEFKTVEVISI